MKGYFNFNKIIHSVNVFKHWICLVNIKEISPKCSVSGFESLEIIKLRSSFIGFLSGW